MSNNPRLSALSLFVLLLMAFSSRLSSADFVSLRGVILDPLRSPVAGVNVTLRNPVTRVASTAASETDGSFRFSSLVPGNYLVEVKAPEFAADVIPVYVSPGDDTTLEIPLRLEAVSEYVTVTGAGSAQSSDEVSRAVTLIDRSETDSRQTLSLAEALRGVPGLRAQQSGGPGSFTRIMFRGLRTTDGSLLIDGLPVRDAAGFRGDLASFFSELNPNNQSSIEVVRGAGSALYGSSANGGVINVTPRIGSGAPQLDFGYEGGSLAQAIGRFSVAGGISRRFGYSAGLVRTDVNSGIDGEDVWRNTNLSSHLQYALQPNMSLSGNFYLSDTPRLDLNDSSFPIGPLGNEFGFETGQGPVVGFLPDLNDPDDRKTSRIVPASLRFTHQPSAMYGYEAAYRVVSSRRNFPIGPRQDPLAERLGIFEFAADLNRFDGVNHLFQNRHNLQLGAAHLLTLGYEHERESRTQEFVAPGFASPPTTDRQRSNALFFHHQATLLNRRLHLGFGGRYQSFDIENPESVSELRELNAPDSYTGDVSISYFLPKTGTKLRSHVGNSFRAPSLSERFSVATLGDQRVRIGNPLIEPERSVGVDGGFDQYLWRERLQISATYFYNRLQSRIQSTNLFQQVNVRGGLSRGAEFEARARPLAFLSLGGSYTYTDSEFIPSFPVLSHDNSLVPAGVARPTEGIPGHMGSFSMIVHRRNWEGFLDLSAVGGYDTPLFSPIAFRQVLFSFGDYTRVNVGAAYTQTLSEKWRLRWFGRVENVFDIAYFENGFRMPGAVAIVGVRFLSGY